jgi:ferredoxin
VEVTLVLPDGSEHTVRCEPGYTLVMASQTLETPIHTQCPDGHCGLCQVEVLAGAEAMRPPSEAECALLDQVLGAARDPRVRLACHARVVGSGARVRVAQVWHIESATGGAG